MTAVEKLNIYTGKSKFSTLVIGITKIKILEKFRKIGIDIDKTVDIDSAVDMDSTYPIDIIGRNPLEIIIEKEEKEAILKAIEMSFPEHRQILELRLFNNMSFKNGFIIWQK